jgi:hypothetical protein
MASVKIEWEVNISHQHYVPTHQAIRTVKEKKKNETPGFYDARC